MNVTATTSATSNWNPSSRNFLKMNTDGSFSAKARPGGWGFVIRDEEGRVCGAGAGNLSAAAEILSELKPKHVSRPCNSRRMGRTELATDAINLKSALESSDFDLSPHGVLIEEAKFMLFSNFLECKVFVGSRFTSRTSVYTERYINCLRFSANLEPAGAMLWPDSVPACVSSFVDDDLPRSSS